MPTVLHMDVGEAVEYIDYLANKSYEDKMYSRWIAGPQYQIGFEEFKKSLEPKKVRKDEEILEELYEKFRKAGIE